CLAFEVNPFLAFVGRAKLQQTDLARFVRCGAAIIKGLRNPEKSALEEYSTFCEGGDKTKWLFNRPVLRSFTGGWNASTHCAPADRALFRLALLRAAMNN